MVPAAKAAADASKEATEANNTPEKVPANADSLQPLQTEDKDAFAPIAITVPKPAVAACKTPPVNTPSDLETPSKVTEVERAKDKRTAGVEGEKDVPPELKSVAAPAPAAEKASSTDHNQRPEPWTHVAYNAGGAQSEKDSTPIQVAGVQKNRSFLAKGGELNDILSIHSYASNGRLKVTLDDPPVEGGYRGTVKPPKGMRRDISLPLEGSNSAVRKDILVDNAVAHQAKLAQKSRKRKSDAPPSATSPSIGAKKMSMENSANSVQAVHSLVYAKAYTEYMQMMAARQQQQLLQEASSRSQIGGLGAGRQHSGLLAETTIANANPTAATTAAVISAASAASVARGASAAFMLRPAGTGREWSTEDFQKVTEQAQALAQAQTQAQAHGAAQEYSQAQAQAHASAAAAMQVGHKGDADSARAVSVQAAAFAAVAARSGSDSGAAALNPFARHQAHTAAAGIGMPAGFPYQAQQALQLAQAAQARAFHAAQVAHAARAAVAHLGTSVGDCATTAMGGSPTQYPNQPSTAHLRHLQSITPQAMSPQAMQQAVLMMHMQQQQQQQHVQMAFAAVAGWNPEGFPPF